MVPDWVRMIACAIAAVCLIGMTSGCATSRADLMPQHFGFRPDEPPPPEFSDKKKPDLDGANTEFAKHRSVIRQALDPSSLIIVRGCFFGLSDEGLQAVAMLFGGTAAVYAPTAAQGFEAAPVTRGQEAAAYDSLARAGLLSRDTLHDGQSEKKEKVLAIAARRGGLVPTQFFITSHSEYTMLKDLSDRDQMSAEAKWLKTRPAFPDPSGWHARSRLSRDELLEHARDLRATYLPEVAPELLMMQDVWLSRLPGEPAAGPSFDTDDPLGGLPPSDMGDGNLLAADAAQVADSTVNVWRSSEMTGTILSVDDHDPLLAGDLRIDPPSSDQRKQANVFDEETLNRLATPPTGEQPFSGRGYVEPLRDGGLRLWNFRIGSGSLRDEFHPALSTLAGTLKDRGTTVTVTGHTSTPGGESANERVALSRARHVASDLIKQGVRPDRVIVMERGEGDPLAPDVISGRADPELAARNRRVEIRPFFIPPPFRESDRGASATADGGRQIAEEVDRLTATSTDPLGHAVDVTTLALDIVGHLGEFAEHAGKFATVAGPVSLLGPVIDWIKFTRDVRRMKEAWLREARVIGLGLGLAATRILAADDRLGVDISAADLERVLRDPETWKQAVLDKKQEDEFREYARTAAAVTLPPARWMDAIRQSLTMTAELVNAVLRQAEAELRRRLMQQGLTADTLESEYKSRLRRLRIECVGQLEHYLKAELAGAGR